MAVREKLIEQKNDSSEALPHETTIGCMADVIMGKSGNMASLLALH